MLPKIAKFYALYIIVLVEQFKSIFGERKTGLFTESQNSYIYLPVLLPLVFAMKLGQGTSLTKWV